MRWENLKCNFIIIHINQCKKKNYWVKSTIFLKFKVICVRFTINFRTLIGNHDLFVSTYTGMNLISDIFRAIYYIYQISQLTLALPRNSRLQLASTTFTIFTKVKPNYNKLVTLLLVSKWLLKIEFYLVFNNCDR